MPQALLNNKQFIKQLSRNGINDAKTFVDKKISILPNGTHIDIHNGTTKDMTKKWNNEWKKWVSQNPNFKIKDIEVQIKAMMKKYKIPKSSIMAKNMVKIKLLRGDINVCHYKNGS